MVEPRVNKRPLLEAPTPTKILMASGGLSLTGYIFVFITRSHTLAATLDMCAQLIRFCFSRVLCFQRLHGGPRFSFHYYYCCCFIFVNYCRLCFISLRWDLLFKHSFSVGDSSAIGLRIPGDSLIATAQESRSAPVSS